MIRNCSSVLYGSDACSWLQRRGQEISKSSCVPRYPSWRELISLVAAIVVAFAVLVVLPPFTYPIAHSVVIAGLLIFFASGLRIIRDDQVGVVTRKMLGPTMPQGQIIARKGEVGVQADTLMPALYWRNPIVWKIEKAPVTQIGENEIDVVESVDGEALPKGRILGDEVECNQFQDAKKFLENHGKKGPQVAHLRPGTYRINTKAFKVQKRSVTNVGEEKIGVVVALDGIPLPPGYIIAPRPEDGKSHKFFQDGQAFLDSDGYRGPQLDTLQPGRYYINPHLFNVTVDEIAEVPPGYVAVLRSNVGAELERSPFRPEKTAEKPVFNQAVHEEAEALLILDKNKRGIWAEPVAAGSLMPG